MSILRRILFVVLFLAGLIALFFAEENWRGQRAWARARTALEAKGEAVDFHKLVPRRPPDSENVMKVPGMESWFIKGGGETWYQNPRRGTNTVFFESAPRSDRHNKNADPNGKAIAEKRYHLGTVRITTDRGEPLEGLDRGAFYEALIGKRMNTPYGGVLYVPRATPLEIEIHSEKPVSGEDLARVMNQTKSDWPVTVENLSSNRFALYGNGWWVTAADYWDWSTKYDKEFASIREALKRPTVWLDGDYSRAFETPIQNYVNMRVMAQLLASRAEAAMLLNRPDDAFDNVMLINDFVRILETTPTTLVSAMIDCAIRGLDGAVIEEGFAAGIWKESHLEAFQKKFKDVGIVERTRNSFRRGELPALINVVENSSIERIDKLFRVLPRGWHYLNLVEYTRLNQIISDSMEIVDGTVSPERVSRAARQVEQDMDRRSPWVRLTRIGMPSSEKGFLVSSKNEDLFRQLLIACELERHRAATGQYPEALDPNAPRDIVTGKPFKYQLRANGEYILYSPGWDLKDDLGPILKDASLSVRDIWKTDAANREWVWKGTPELKKHSVADARR